MYERRNQVLDRAIAFLVLGIVLLTAVILFVAKADATTPTADKPIPAPKSEKLKPKPALDTKDFPRGFTLHGVQWEITYVEHIWHSEEEGVPPEDLAGQVYREGKLVAINITKNSIPAAVRMEIIRRLAEVADGDKQKVHQLTIENPKLVEWLVK